MARERNEIAAPYAINAQGWNSGAGDYSETRKSGRMRIAIVGDSFVEALQVAHTRSVGEQLSQELANAASQTTEVFRFGISGAPLSQYLYMVEHTVVRYKPDWIVIVLVHNDFDESFRFVPGRYTSSFLKLRLDNGRVIDEIAPTPWRSNMVERLRRTAIARYFYYRWQVRPDTLRNAFFGTAHAEGLGRFAANIDATATSRLSTDIAAATDYLFVRLQTVARSIGAQLLFVMDGDRGAIYSDIPTSFPLTLNRMAGEIADRRHIPFVDLHPIFAADWMVNHSHFEFVNDFHWNERGHMLAARAISAAIRASHPLREVSGPRPR